MQATQKIIPVLVALIMFAGCDAAATQKRSAPAETTSSSMQSVEGRWGTPGSRDGELDYLFEAGGTYRGWDGCNTTSGTWSEDRGEVALIPEGGSMKGCPGLPVPETFRLVDDTLVVTAKDSSAEWKLSRASD